MAGTGGFPSRHSLGVSQPGRRGLVDAPEQSLGLRCREDGSWIWKADASLFNVPLPDQSDPTLIARYWKAIDSITCPILEVRGAECSLVSDQTIEQMKQRGKQVTSVDIPNAGHVVAVDKPYEFIEATRSFLGANA